MAKRAMCIGINDYPGTNMDLKGCVNDANDWAAALSARGFEVQKLTDAQATKAAMVAGIRSLVQGAAPGDSVVISYSGHGTYAPDENGDEPDGLDEALCPYDIMQGNVLIDDEIHQLFAQHAQGVKIVLISDSCHSGTVTRAAAAEPDDNSSLRPRFMPMGNWLPESKLPRAANGRPATQVAITTTHSPWAGALALGGDSDVLLAGCAEGPNNFSYDAMIAGRPNGAFTYYALKTLKNMKPTSTYAEWHNAIRQFLPSVNYQQTPQLFCSKASRRTRILA